jgi:uroporphyrinogen decarboxylase
VRWKTGGETLFPPDDLPVPVPEVPAARPDFHRFDPAALPERIGYIPVSQGLRFDLDPEHLFDAVVAVVERAGPELAVHGEVTSPLDYFLDLYGFEQAMVGCLEDPGRAKAVLGRFTDGLVLLAGGLASTGVDAVKISSPYAGAGFLSRAFYREFVLPFESRLARAIESRGVRAYLHTCGDIHDRLELMADSGASGIECLDPPPLGRVELADAKARVGGRIFIKGNVDPVHTLLAGDMEKVREDARRRIAVGKPGGRFVLSTACSIAPHTPPENVALLHEAVEAWGAY